MQHHPNYHYHHFNFIIQPFFHFLLLLLLAVSHPHHISLVLSHPIPISESEVQLPSSKSNIIITQTSHPDPQLGVRAVQGLTPKKTIEGDSGHRNSDDDANGNSEKELATEGIVSTWNDQILEWDDLTKCIRESESGNAIERWLDCLESTSTLKPSDKISGLEEVHPSGFRTGIGIGNGHVEVANDPLFEFTDKLKMEASTDSSASLKSSEEGFARIEEVEGSVSTEYNEGAEWVADSEVGRFSKDDGFVLSLGQKDDDDDDSPESNFGGGGTILGDRVSNVGVPVGLGLQENRMSRHDLGFPGQVSGWVMQSDSSPGSTDPQALQNRMTNEGKTGSEVALDATESSTTTQNKRQNLMGAMKLAACLGVVVMLLWRKKTRLGITQESLVSEQMEEYPRPSATGFSMTARSASNTDIGYPDVKAGSLPAPLGMAIATVMAEQVLAHEDNQSNLQSADELSKLLEAAMTESLAPVMGGECTGFVEQFKQSFRSTYRLIGSVRRASVKNLTHPSPARRNTKSPKFAGPPRREIRRLHEESDSFTTGISNVSRGNSSLDTGVESGVQQFSSHVGADSESDLAEKFSKLTFSARNPKKEVGSTSITDMESPGSGIFQNLFSSEEGQSRSANQELLSELGDASSSLRHGVSDDGLSDKSRSKNILRGFETQIHENGATSRLGRSGSGFSCSGRESTSGLGLSHSQSGYGALNQATRSSLESFGGDLDLAIQPFGLTPPGQLVTTSEAEETMLSGLSHHGGGGRLQHEMLLVLKQQNYLKSLELSYKLRGLSMKEENLHLTSEQNTLMRENVDLSRNKAEFKEAEFQDRKLVLAYSNFTRRCADELVAGLCVMLCALFFGAWNYSYSRLVDVVSTCQPYLHEQSNSMIPGMNKLINSLNMFTSQLHMFICEVTVASRMFFGLGVISIVAAALLRKSVSSNSQAMPATILIIILGGLCGIAGKFAVDSMGGSGRHWLLMWELFCVIHTTATCFTPFLYWVLNGTPPSTISSAAAATGKGQRRKFHLVAIPPWLRRLVFHICMVLVLPVLAGLLPFATVREIVRVFGSGFHNLVFSPIEVYLRERFHFSLL